MFNLENYLPTLFIAYTLLLLLVIVLFFVHRRNNKKHLLILEEKLYNFHQNANQRQQDQFDSFKQGLQQLINDLSKRITSNEHHIAHIINQLDEMYFMPGNSEDEADVPKISENNLTNEPET
ncbi:MAG: hypothetical protein M0Q90_14795 [Bacteroidales bacterium]|nr:hypothetical protein [Bacteroidales bacterium]